MIMILPVLVLVKLLMLFLLHVVHYLMLYTLLGWNDPIARNLTCGALSQETINVWANCPELTMTPRTVRSTSLPKMSAHTQSNTHTYTHKYTHTQKHTHTHAHTHAYTWPNRNCTHVHTRIHIYKLLINLTLTTEQGTSGMNQRLSAPLRLHFTQKWVKASIRISQTMIPSRSTAMDCNRRRTWSAPTTPRQLQKRSRTHIYTHTQMYTHTRTHVTEQ